MHVANFDQVAISLTYETANQGREKSIKESRVGSVRGTREKTIPRKKRELRESENKGNLCEETYPVTQRIHGAGVKGGEQILGGEKKSTAALAGEHVDHKK